MRFAFSHAKAEKVVNPPQKPIASTYFQSASPILFFCRKPRTIPISRLPEIFTIKVAKGNFESKFLFITTEEMYRSTLPKPPPRPTNNTFLNI